MEVQLLLARPAGTAPAAFAGALQGALPPGATLALALPDDALPALAHVATRDSQVPDALVTLATADATATTATAALVALADPARSTVVAGIRHAVLPGRDAIRLFFGLRRLPALSRAAFHDYWLNRHAQIGRRLIPPYSYHQVHADAAATGRTAAATGLAQSTYDGIVEVHFPDIAALVRQLSRAEVAVEALEDERNFIDHFRSQFWAFAEQA